MTTAGYDDTDALVRFARSVDVMTFEFENVPVEAAEVLESEGVVRPGSRALATAQDRLVEKTFVRDLGLRTAPFAPVDDDHDVAAAVEQIGVPGILKTRRDGYDGQAQRRITELGQAAPAWDDLARRPCIYEGFVDFTCEISVIGARGIDGRIVCFEPGENVHREGILRTTTVPSTVGTAARREAVAAAERVLTAFDYVGVIGVELFVVDDGLVVNELAPRVHNSGHWTQDGCVIDQFEQHVRAIAGWPLGDGARHSDVTMTNLIGEDVTDLDGFRADPRSGIHLYGKRELRPGRKMGHVNHVRPRSD